MQAGNLLTLMRQKVRLRPAIMQLMMVRDQAETFEKLEENKIPILQVCYPVNQLTR